MRIKDGVIKNFLKGHIAASIIDSYMDIANPFEKGEHMVVTGSASTYYLWHKGLSENYIYKPPSDVDIILSIPPDNPRSLENVPRYQSMMRQATKDAIAQTDLDITHVMSDRYDAKIRVGKTFSPDEIHHILTQSRISEVLDRHNIKNLKIDDPISASMNIDMMVLDNTIMEKITFYNHPKAEESLLRRETLSASLAFKIARTAMKAEDAAGARPGDLVDTFNVMNAAGFEYNPALLRIMAILVIAQRTPPSFSFQTDTLNNPAATPDELREALRKHYNFAPSPQDAKSILNAWNAITQEVFPQENGKGAFLTPSEEEFIMNFMMPYSGHPRYSINTELLKDTPEKRAVFEERPEMDETIRNNSFTHHRVMFRQISPMEIDI